MIANLHGWDVVFSDELFFVNHLCGSNDLCHDNKLIAGDDIITAVVARCPGSRQKIRHADNHQS